MRKVLNIVLVVVFAALTINGAYRISTGPPQTPGRSQARNEGYMTSGYIFTGLFGALTLVFGARVIKGRARE